jgi:hypothetical protein
VEAANHGAGEILSNLQMISGSCASRELKQDLAKRTQFKRLADGSQPAKSCQGTSLDDLKTFTIHLITQKKQVLEPGDILRNQIWCWGESYAVHGLFAGHDHGHRRCLGH